MTDADLEARRAERRAKRETRAKAQADMSVSPAPSAVASTSQDSSTRSKGSDPIAAFSALVDLPLKFEMPSALVEKLNILARDSSQQAGHWTNHYGNAIALTTEVQAWLELETLEVQKESVAASDNSGIREKYIQGPRKSVDKHKAELKQELNQLSKEWSDRFKRQSKQLSEQFRGQVSESVQFDTAEDKQNAETSVETMGSWRREFDIFVARCFDEWIASATERYRAASQEIVQKRTALVVAEFAGMQPPTLPVLPNPSHRGSSTISNPDKKFETPQIGAIVIKGLRSNIMAISMAGTVVMGATIFLGPAAGGGRASSMGVKAGVLLLALPFLIGFGIVSARKKREKLIRDGLKKAKDDYLSLISKELNKEIDAVKDALSRWVGQLDEQWRTAFEVELEQRLSGELNKLELLGAEKSKEAKLLSMKASEKLSNLRSLKNQLNSQLFELKKRQRDLG